MEGRIIGFGERTRYLLDGLPVSKEAFDRAFPDRLDDGGTTCSLSHTPVKGSLALAVHPAQVEEAREQARRHGVPTEYQPDGTPIITSRAHQKALCKIRGVHNNDGGYGD
jgi:hypothetical protein